MTAAFDSYRLDDDHQYVRAAVRELPGKAITPCAADVDDDSFCRLEKTYIRQLVQDAVYHADHAGGGVPKDHRANGSVDALAQGSRDSEAAKT